MSDEQFDALAWAKRAAEALRACHNWMQGEFSDSDFDRDGELSEADAAAFSAAYDADKAIAAIALMRGQSGAVSLLDKKYDAESLYDATRDFGEALDENFTPAWKEMPTDQYGFAKGEFRVRFTWTPPKEDSADEQ